jgi:hypothetical protein
MPELTRGDARLIPGRRPYAMPKPAIRSGECADHHDVPRIVRHRRLNSDWC